MKNKATALLPEGLCHGHFFSLPNEIFELGLKPGELAVYCYLRRCANRETYQCWPSYKSIGAAVGMSFNTVRKNVCALVDKRLIATEDTSIVDRRGMKLERQSQVHHSASERCTGGSPQTRTRPAGGGDSQVGGAQNLRDSKEK